MGNPPEIFNHLTKHYSIFPQLDVCCTKENKKCNEYITRKNNALTRKWTKDFFMNPPYSKVLEFVDYAQKQCNENNVKGICLTFSHTDNRLFHKYILPNRPFFFKGRIKFLLDNAIPRKCYNKLCNHKTYQWTVLCKACYAKTTATSPTYASVGFLLKPRNKNKGTAYERIEMRF